MRKPIITLLVVMFCVNTYSQMVETSNGVDIGSTFNSYGVLRVLGQQAYLELLSQTNKSCHFNLKNDEGFWHLSGPRSYEANSPFAIYWNDGQYHRLFALNTKGYLGIGVDNPLAPLHSVGTYNMIQLRLERKGSYEGFCDLGGANGNFQIWSGGYNKAHKFIVNGSNGYVGIGTLSPEHQLQVDGHIMIKSNTYAHIGVERPDLNGKLTMGITNGTQQGFLSSKGEIKFLTGENTLTKMLIDNNGKVGIGTTNLESDYLLSVNGRIRAKEIKVETNWVDFVFKEDYQLKSLPELETFIKENKHLPGIPSEEQVKQEGISVGEMNAKLLQKIEELTLYLIG
jgi:hypothetical protein